MIVYPDAAFYSMVKVEDVPEIVSEHLLKGRVVTRLVIPGDGDSMPASRPWSDTDFYKKQHRIALRNCGVINPEVIEEYIGTGGYQALGKVLTEMTPDEVIQTMHGHRPPRTEAAAASPPASSGSWRRATTRIRSMSAVTPMRATRAHSWTVPFWKAIPTQLLEAMAIAGYAIGASQGYIYVRAEYPIAVERLKIAIDAGEGDANCWARISSAQALILIST